MIRILPVIPPKVTAFLLLGLVASMSGCMSVPAQYQQSSPIALQKSFFGGYKYTYEGGEPTKILGFLTYTDPFKSLMMEEPAAWVEAERAVTYHYVSAAAAIGFSAWIILDAFESGSNDPYGGGYTFPIGPFVAEMAVLGVLGYLSQQHMLNAVGIFNNEAGHSTDQSSWARPLFSVLPNTLRVDPVRGNYGFGWRLGTPVNW